MSQKQERFQRYLDEYEKLVLKNINNHVHRQVAEDIAQETFLKLYKHLDELQDEQVKPWLLIVSSNIAIDYVRKGGNFDNISFDDETEADRIEQLFETPEECIDKILNQEAACNLLQTALELLYKTNPIWYNVMVDFYMLEIPAKEIAKKHKLTVTNVDVIKIRAKKFLCKKLGKEYMDIF